MQSTHPTKTPYFPSLDGLRFLCAAWVALSHFFPSLYPLPDGFVINGYWAVAIFFVISGLCIHTPYVSGNKLNVSKFYAARFMRIIPPMAISIYISIAWLNNFPILLGVLWSLYCEIIYYALYPIILLLLRKYTHLKLILFSYYVFIITIFVRNLIGPSPYETFILAPLFGLPLWLLGCILAEALIQKDVRLQCLSNLRALVALRILIISISLLLGINALFIHISSIMAMCLLGPIIFYWLYAEMSQARYSKLLLNLSGPGKASYSLYLTHSLAVPLAIFLGLLVTSPVNCLTYLIAVTALTTIFYFLIEKPAHQLSKKLSK